MKLQFRKSFIAIVVVLILVAARLWHRRNEMAHPHLKAVLQAKDDAALSVYSHRNAPVVTTNNRVLRPGLNPFLNLGSIRRANDFTDAEKIEFTNLFVTRLEPAAEKWTLAYTNRVPFGLADLTPNKVLRRMRRGDSTCDSYTFVIGDIVLGIQTVNGDTYVNYLASSQGLATVNTQPQPAGAPDGSMPVTREQVMQMVQADCGQHFAPDELTLKPTGESGPLTGGADAEINPVYRPFTPRNSNFSIVFTKDGTLAYCLRRP